MSLLTLLIIYSAALVLLGWWIGRRVRKSGDFFVAGRSLGAGLVFATFLAPNIGAGSTVGATSLSYHNGLAAWWWNGSAGLGSLILALWVGPRIWREAKRLQLLTVGDFLEHRFGRTVRGVSALVIWLGSLFVLCAQLDGAAAVLRIAGGLPHAWGCLIATVVTAAYFTAGGLASTARVNGIQLAVKLIGFLAATPLAFAAAGGVAAVANLNAGRLDWLHATSPVDGWPLVFTLGPAFFLSPGLLQKAYGARDERALTRGVAWNGIALMLFAFVPIALGLCARVLYPNLQNADEALPAILSSIPLAVGGLALAAVFSAELSAADAVLFMLSTSGARDLYHRFAKQGATDSEILRVARMAGLLGAALAFALTFVFPTVVGALKIFYSVLVVTLFVPILGGLYLPAGGRRGALLSMSAGVAVLFGVQAQTSGAGFGWASPTFVALVASGCVYFGAALWTRPRRGDPLPATSPGDPLVPALSVERGDTLPRR